MHHPYSAELYSNLFGLASPLRSRLASFVLGYLVAGSIALPTRAADIQIRDLNDINFGEVPATVGTLEGDSSVCVAMRPRGRYSLRGFGSGTNGAFSMVDLGNGVHTLDYSVFFSHNSRGRGQQLTPGQRLRRLRASRFRNNGRCNPRGRIRVVVDGQDIQAAHPGSYGGTLTLTVEPE